MKRETLDYLGAKFGDQRFTVADYIGPRAPQPWETKDVSEELERAARGGGFVSRPTSSCCTSGALLRRNVEQRLSVRPAKPVVAGKWLSRSTGR